MTGDVTGGVTGGVTGDAAGDGPGASRPARRSRWRDRLLRAVFLAAVVGCGAWSLDGRWDEVGHALAGVAPLLLVAAVVLTCLGLLVTSVVWRRLLRAFGHDVPAPEARAVFFVSQLGKYVPGAVWAIGVQARMAARYAVPVRVSVTVALMFTVVHLVTAGIFAGVLVLAFGVAAQGPTWLWVLGTAGCVLPLVPAVGAPLLRRAAGVSVRLPGREALLLTALMAVVWVLYATAVLLLVPDPGARTWVVVGVAFAAGYVAGVVVVVAPAGLGAREAAFVVVLSPVTGLPVATAVALLARLVHAAADALMAAAAWEVGRRSGRARRSGDAAPGGEVAELSVAGGTVRAHDDHRL